MPSPRSEDPDDEVYPLDYFDQEAEATTRVLPKPFEEDLEDEWEDPHLYRGRVLFSLETGSRVVSAWATPCSDEHVNVHRLEIPQWRYHHLLRWIAGKLPGHLQAWLETTWPEWFLPPVLFLKRQKPQWGEEFKLEKEAYAALKPVQGVFVPVCYGEVLCCLGDDWSSSSKRRGLLLSYLDGSDLCSRDCPELGVSQLAAMLQEALTAAADLGVMHGDPKLDNVYLVKERTMLVDWERWNNPAEKDRTVQYLVSHLTTLYTAQRKAWAEE